MLLLVSGESPYDFRWLSRSASWIERSFTTFSLHDPLPIGLAARLLADHVCAGLAAGAIAEHQGNGAR
jgi:hypothetical protein